MEKNKLRETQRISGIKKRKQIEQLTIDGVLIRKWNSLSEIQQETGFCAGNICECCKGKYVQMNGYKWRYAV